MNPPRELKVYMQLGPPEEPIRGEVEAPSGERTAFSGWIALVAEIEAARTPTPVGGQRSRAARKSPRRRLLKTDGPVEQAGSPGDEPRCWIDERTPGLI